MTSGGVGENNSQEEGEDAAVRVRRREFVKATAATGVATGLAGRAGADGARTAGTVRQEEITLQWVVLSSQDREATEQALRDAGLPDRIQLDQQSSGDITDELQAQYNQWLSAQRSEPTLLTVDNGWTIPFILRDQFQNLSEMLSEDKLDRIESDYFEASVNTATHPETGDLYAVPMFPEPPTIQYRKDVVEDAGYDPEGEEWATNPLTWQEFSRIASDVHEQSDIEHAYTWQGQGPEQVSCCVFNEMLSSWGGAYFGGLDNLFGPVGDRPVTVDEEPVVDAVRMARSFIYGSDDEEALDGYEQISPTDVIELETVPSMQQFNDGNAIFHRQWLFSIPVNGADDAFGEDLGVMPMPWAVPEEESEYDGIGGTSPALGGWHVAINPFAPDEKQEAALEFLDAFMTEEFMLDHFEINGWMPPDRTVFDSEQARDVPVMGRYLDPILMSIENAVPRPITPVWPQESDRIFQEFQAAIQQQKTPEAAMGNLNETLQDIEESF